MTRRRWRSARSAGRWRRCARGAAAGADRADAGRAARAARGPRFLAAVLRFLEGHEPDLVACAEALGVPPARLVAARRGAGAMSRPLLITRLRRRAAPLRAAFRRVGRPRRTASPSRSTRRASPARCATTRRRAGDRGAGLAAARHLLRQRDASPARSSPARVEALRAIGARRDIVILTNIGDQYRANRVAQLERFDIRHRVLCNQGGKGRPVAELIAEMRPSATVFVDDLPVHHESVAKHAPGVWRLHMIAEPRIAAITPPAPSPMPGSTPGATLCPGYRSAEARRKQHDQDRLHLRSHRRHRPGRGAALRRLGLERRSAPGGARRGSTRSPPSLATRFCAIALDMRDIPAVEAVARRQVRRGRPAAQQCRPAAALGAAAGRRVGAARARWSRPTSPASSP